MPVLTSRDCAVPEPWRPHWHIPSWWWWWLIMSDREYTEVQKLLFAFVVNFFDPAMHGFLISFSKYWVAVQNSRTLRYNNCVVKREETIRGLHSTGHVGILMATRSWRGIVASSSGSANCVRMAVAWLCIVTMCPVLAHGQFVSLYIEADEYSRLTG